MCSSSSESSTSIQPSLHIPIPVMCWILPLEISLFWATLLLDRVWTPKCGTGTEGSFAIEGLVHFSVFLQNLISLQSYGCVSPLPLLPPSFTLATCLNLADISISTVLLGPLWKLPLVVPKVQLDTLPLILQVQTQQLTHWTLC